MAAFEVTFNIRKELKKRKFMERSNRSNRSTTTRAFVFLAKFAEFMITKYLKHKVDGNLSVCVDERGPYVT